MNVILLVYMIGRFSWNLYLCISKFKELGNKKNDEIIRLIIKGIVVIRISLGLSLNSTLEMSLEKYRKIISNPLIIIKNKKIDRI